MEPSSTRPLPRQRQAAAGRPKPQSKWVTLQPVQDDPSSHYMEPVRKREAPSRWGTQYAELNFSEMARQEAERRAAPPRPARSDMDKKAAKQQLAEQIEQVQGELGNTEQRLFETKKQLEAFRKEGGRWTKKRTFLDNAGASVEAGVFLKQQIDRFNRQIEQKKREETALEEMLASPSGSKKRPEGMTEQHTLALEELGLVEAELAMARKQLAGARGESHKRELQQQIDQLESRVEGLNREIRKLVMAEIVRRGL